MVRCDSSSLVSEGGIRPPAFKYVTRNRHASSLILPASSFIRHCALCSIQSLQRPLPHVLPCPVIVILKAYLVRDVLINFEHEGKLPLHLGIDIETALLRGPQLLYLAIILYIVSLK